MKSFKEIIIALILSVPEMLLVTAAVIVIGHTITEWDKETKANASCGDFLYITDDYTDTISFSAAKEIQEQGLVSIITIYDIPAILIQQEEEFFIVIDNKYYVNGIHNWEHRHQIYHDLIVPKPD